MHEGPLPCFMRVTLPGCWICLGSLRPDVEFAEPSEEKGFQYDVGSLLHGSGTPIQGRVRQASAAMPRYLIPDLDREHSTSDHSRRCSCLCVIVQPGANPCDSAIPHVNLPLFFLANSIKTSTFPRLYLVAASASGRHARMRWNPRKTRMLQCRHARSQHFY